jgi:RNA polymerase-binding transcription factor DksA
MDRRKRDRFREQLEVIQQRIRVDSSAVAEQALDSVNGELSHVPLHLGDLGSEEFYRDMSAVLAENEAYLANEVRDAIGRIESGIFGKCEHCEKAISLARLEAIPFARFCVRCAEQFNGSPSGNLNDGRPRGPRDTIAPEGEMAENGRRRGRSGDVHAVGDAGGGTAWGGLAGSNFGHGDPTVANLQDAAGSGSPEAAEERFVSWGHAVQPIDYESEDDRKRYSEEVEEDLGL